MQCIDRIERKLKTHVHSATNFEQRAQNNIIVALSTQPVHVRFVEEVMVIRKFMHPEIRIRKHTHTHA